MKLKEEKDREEKSVKWVYNGDKMLVSYADKKERDKSGAFADHNCK